MFDHFFGYGQINQVVTDILSSISHLFEALGASEFFFLFISTKDLKRAERITCWMMGKSLSIMEYFAA